MLGPSHRWVRSPPARTTTYFRNTRQSVGSVIVLPRDAAADRLRSKRDEIRQLPVPLSDRETAARTLIEIANGVEAVQDSRIHIEKVNGTFLFEFRGTPDQYLAELKHTIDRGWIVMHESGTFFRFTPAGADRLA